MNPRCTVLQESSNTAGPFFVLVVFFLNRLKREENLSQVSEQPSAVVVSSRVVQRWITEVVRCNSRVTVPTGVTSAFVALIGGLVDNSQVGVEEGVTRQQEEDKDHKSQHEDNAGKS